MSLVNLLKSVLSASGWELVHHAIREERTEVRSWPGEISLKARTYSYLKASFPDGVYQHQAEGIKRYMAGRDVAMCTGTASGKSAVFYAAAIQELAHNDQARSLVLYPLKALGREQQQRWEQALRAAGLSKHLVGRIDGDVPTSSRLNILRNSRVVIATPDVVHTWLLPNVGTDEGWGFLSQLRLLVVDEAHVYTGVFGSHAAFLFRRLQHLANMAQSRYQCITASATIRDPERHLQSLFGRQFTLVDESLDTSAQHQIDIIMVQPPVGKDLTSSVTSLLEALVEQTDAKFITFVDSRKQVETVATVLSRAKQVGAADRLATSLTDLHVVPYRAGYEDADRREIERKLSSGDLRGVVSTSALELGIDIPHLDVGVLLGVPRSRTNLQQRIGRVGRRRPGTVIIINAGDLFSEAMFSKPNEVLSRPLAESALYLENLRVQYIHAMCLARPFGEHEQAALRCGASVVTEAGGLSTLVDWPPGFLALCVRELTGEVSAELQGMKAEAGETPHYAFPLRNVDSQFEVELRQGADRQRLGTLSHSQVMRETYPGAVYYHITRPYRVVSIALSSKVVKVRKEKSYTTKPTMVPAIVYPNLGTESVHRGVRHGSLVMVEADLQVRESVVGYKERRGPTETAIQYPLQGSITYNQRMFTRNFFTTGAVVFHPVFCDPRVKIDSLAGLVYECFLMEIPFDRQDVSFASGTLKVARGPLQVGDRFVAVYDQTCGSLRLSGRLLEDGVATRVWERAIQLAKTGNELFPAALEASDCLEKLLAESREPRTQLLDDFVDLQIAAGRDDACERVRVIMPGSSGLNVRLSNEEFEVEAVFFNPALGPSYRGHRASSVDRSVPSMFQVGDIVAIPGESIEGWYNPATGELTEI